MGRRAAEAGPVMLGDSDPIEADLSQRSTRWGVEAQSTWPLGAPPPLGSVASRPSLPSQVPPGPEPTTTEIRAWAGGLGAHGSGPRGPWT